MKRRYLPALRGIFGDWAYYSCVMSLREVADRVSFADEIHKSKELSKLIQRELRTSRTGDIANYLETEKERFFNSLVVAVYGGDPAWHGLSEVTPEADDFQADEVSEQALSTLGFLSLTGEEKLFALDGQHRLAGIQAAVKGSEEVADDEVSVIFVSHHNDRAGLIRTRQLFTTLNKTARRVSKGETIALDEADVMAITCRYLVENDKRFKDDRILVVGKENLPPDNDTHLTTIANLYDVLSILFTKVIEKKHLKDLQYHRPADEELKRYFEQAGRYFGLLAATFPELEAFFSSKAPENVVRAQRGPTGGSILFRPAGQTIFVNLLAAVMKGRTLEQAVKLLGHLPTDLNGAPYADLVWNRAAGTMDLRRKALTRRLALYMLGEMSAVGERKLRTDLARLQGLETITLPAKVAALPTRTRTRKA